METPRFLLLMLSKNTHIRLIFWGEMKRWTTCFPPLSFCVLLFVLAARFRIPRFKFDSIFVGEIRELPTLNTERLKGDGTGWLGAIKKTQPRFVCWLSLNKTHMFVFGENTFFWGERWETCCFLFSPVCYCLFGTGLFVVVLGWLDRPWVRAWEFDLGGGLFVCVSGFPAVRRLKVRDKSSPQTMNTMWQNASCCLAGTQHPFHHFRGPLGASWFSRPGNQTKNHANRHPQKHNRPTGNQPPIEPNGHWNSKEISVWY